MSIPLHLFVTPGVAGSVPDPADVFLARLRAEWRVYVTPLPVPLVALPGLFPVAVGRLWLEHRTHGWNTLLTDLGILDCRLQRTN